MADLSSADGEKVVLVHISERARPVRFRGNNEDLKIAIRNVFVMYFQTARNSFFRYVDPLFVLSVIHESVLILDSVMDCLCIKYRAG